MRLSQPPIGRRPIVSGWATFLGGKVAGRQGPVPWGDLGRSDGAISTQFQAIGLSFSQNDLSEALTKMAKKRTSVDPDIAESFKSPASFVNRFYVTIDPGGVRLAFAEKREGYAASVRCALMISHADAMELANLLKAALAPAPTNTKQ
jgi:hypothetical protein